MNFNLKPWRSSNKTPGATMARFAFAHWVTLMAACIRWCSPKRPKVRVISFRKANKREVLAYEQETQTRTD